MIIHVIPLTLFDLVPDCNVYDHSRCFQNVNRYSRYSLMLLILATIVKTLQRYTFLGKEARLPLLKLVLILVSLLLKKHLLKEV